MGTFSQIKARVQRRVIDLPTAVLDEVPTLVNEAYFQAQRDHNFQVMKDTVEPTTASVRTLVAMPANFKAYRGKPYYVTDTGNEVPMDIALTRQIAMGTFSVEAEGAPYIISETDPAEDGSASWEVWPLPDGSSDYVDGEFRVVVPYWKFLPELSADGDSNWLTNKGEEFIVAKAVASAFALDWDDDHGLVWETQAKDKWNKLIRLDNMRVLGQINTMVPYSGAYEGEQGLK